jgi:hypothetical protein
VGEIMPYQIKQNGDNYEVINSETEEVKAVHEPPDAKEKAERQVRMLESMENHEGWDGD